MAIQPLPPSRFFHPDEASSHDGALYPVEWRDRWAALATLLCQIRAAWGAPLRVVSGYRTKAWNTRVGGAKKSQHVEGRAADIAPMGPPSQRADEVSRLHAMVLQMYDAGDLMLLGGLGDYPSRWIHCDIAKAKDGHLRRWVGTTVGSEQA